MSESHPVIGVLIFILFIIISGILYGYVAALQAVNENDISEKMENGDALAAKLMKLLDNPNKLTDVTLITAIIINMIQGAFVIGMITNGINSMCELSGTDIHILIAVLVSILVFIFFSVFGIMVPRKLAEQNPHRWLFGLYKFVTFIIILFTPVSFIITKLCNVVLRIVGIDPSSINDNVTEEEIITMVNEGHEQGVLLASEAEMITNIVEFGEKEAKDIMTHRVNVVAFDVNLTINEVFDMITEESFSRYPIYDGNINDIVGVLHFRDLVKAYSDGHNRRFALKDMKDEILFEAHIIPETRNIDDLFKSMQAEKVHMAVVIDEYGQMSGVVTMEDILEEIVGNIMDEYDEEETSIYRHDNDTYEMDGSTQLEDIQELFDIDFDVDDIDTLSGFLTYKHGSIPEEGNNFTIEYGGYIFKVKEIENKIIKKVLVSRCK